MVSTERPQRVIVVIDDDPRPKLINSLKSSGYNVRPQIHNLAELNRKVRYWKRANIIPDIAVIDGYIQARGDGDIVSRLFKDLYPECKQIAYSGETQTYGDVFLEKRVDGTPEELNLFLTTIARLLGDTNETI